MEIVGNFINLTKSEMVDPSLKISVRAGRTHMDPPHTVQDLEVYFDPQIQLDRLMRPLSSEEIADSIKWNLTLPQDNLVPIHSKERTQIYGISFTELTNYDDKSLPIDKLVLICNSDIDSFGTKNIFLNRQTQNIRKGDFNFFNLDIFEISELILNSILQFYNYRISRDERIKWEGYVPKKHLKLVLDKEFAEQLPCARERIFEPYSETQIVFDARSVEP